MYIQSLCSKLFYLPISILFQVCGTGVLCIGVWLAVDKTSFIHLTKFSSIEGVEVSFTNAKREPRDLSCIFIHHHSLAWFCHIYHVCALLFTYSVKFLSCVLKTLLITLLSTLCVVTYSRIWAINFNSMKNSSQDCGGLTYFKKNLRLRQAKTFISLHEFLLFSSFCILFQINDQVRGIIRVRFFR